MPIGFEAKTDRELLLLCAEGVNNLGEDMKEVKHNVCKRFSEVEKRQVDADKRHRKLSTRVWVLIGILIGSGIIAGGAIEIPKMLGG